MELNVKYCTKTHTHAHVRTYYSSTEMQSCLAASLTLITDITRVRLTPKGLHRWSAMIYPTDIIVSDRALSCQAACCAQFNLHAAWNNNSLQIFIIHGKHFPVHVKCASIDLRAETLYRILLALWDSIFKILGVNYWTAASLMQRTTRLTLFLSQHALYQLPFTIRGSSTGVVSPCDCVCVCHNGKM